MPFQYVIYPQYRLVVSTGEGRFTFEEACAHQDKLLSDPDFHPEFNQLIDGTTVTEYALSVGEIRMLVSRDIFAITSRRSFVVASPFMYGIARMLKTYHEISKGEPPTNIFRDRAEALKWLGIPEDSGLL